MIQDLPGSSYSIPKIKTNYGKFNIRFIGAKIWNSLSESAKKTYKNWIQRGFEKWYNSTV